MYKLGNSQGFLLKGLEHGYADKITMTNTGIEVTIKFGDSTCR